MTSRTSSRAPARFEAVLAGLCGLAWGVGLARALYEHDPAGLAWLGEPAGVLLLAVLAGGAGWGLRVRGHPWSPPPAEPRAGGPGISASPRPPASVPWLLPLVAVFDPAVNPLRLWVLLAAGPVLGVLFAAGTPVEGGGARGEGRTRIAHYGLRISYYVSRFAPPLLAFLLPFCLYLLTLAPTVGEADTFEFQVNAVRLAVAHPSGYPLYILIGKLFSLLPLPGQVAYRINLSSAFFGGAAALAVYVLVLRLTGRRLPALLAAWTFGLSFGLWSRAVEAEVYTLHASFVAVILLVLVGMGNSEQGAGVRGQGLGVRGYALRFAHGALGIARSPVPLLGLLFGLSLSNHLTTALLAPAAAAALLAARPHLPWQAWLKAGGLFLLGLAVYLYIPLRWPAVNNGEVMSLGQFAAFVTGQSSQGALRLNAWLADPGRYAIVGGKALAEFGWAGALLALAGLAWLLWRRVTRPMAGALLLAYAAFFYFGLSFYVPDPDFSAFLLPAHLVQCVWIGAGVAALGQGFGGRGQGIGVAGYALRVTDYVLRFAYCVLLASAFLLPLSFIWRHYARVDRSQAWSKYELGRVMLAEPLAEGALVLADSEKIAPLYYLQVAEGARPDLAIAVLPNEAAYRAALDEGIARGQTVYLGRYLPGLQGFFHLRSLGPLTEAGLAPLTIPPPIEQPREAVFGGAARLLGADAKAGWAEAGGALRLTLFWRAEAEVDHNYLVRLRLVDERGQARQETLGRLPANGFYPTNAWRVGEIVPDYHQVDLDGAVAPGAYRLQAGLFAPFSEQGLALEDGGVWAEVMPVEVRPAGRAPRIAMPVRFVFGGAVNADSGAGDGYIGPPLQAVGFDLPEAAPPGANVTARVYWVAPDAPAGERVSYVLTAGDGAALAEGEFEPGLWPPGTVIQTRLSFRAPAEAGSLSVGLAVPGREARCGWLRPVAPVAGGVDAGGGDVGEHIGPPLHGASGCALRTVQIAGEALDPEAVNFGDLILLRGVSLETPQAGPGQMVRVTLDWQALASISEDYTVFVHLLGPDGLVHGQNDTWPVQGARPTSGWRPGERLADAHEVRVPDDAPPGEYEIEIGWYLLRTLERLPVLGEDGAVVDDKVLQNGLTIEGG